MTVSTENNKVIHVTDGIQDTFAYDFIVLDADHMLAYLDGVLQSSSLYTVTDVGNPAGGNVVFTVAPAAGELTLLRSVPIKQLIDYNEYDPFPAETHETGLDLGTMVDQQQQEEIDRSVKAPVFDPESVDYTLPSYDAGKAIMWTESDPKGITNSDDQVNGIVTAAQAAQAAAEAAQTAAEAAQTGAETAETNAETAETNAEAWAEAAAGSTPPGVTSGSAKAWAETAEDVEVVTGKYSALHWAAKAEAAAAAGLYRASEHVATAGQTLFVHPVPIENETISINGAILDSTDYSTSTTDLTLAVGANEGDIVRIASIGVIQASDYVLRAGDTMTGFLTLSAAPTADLHASTKKYVDDEVAVAADAASFTLQQFVASGTWTKPAGLKFVEVWVVGGGGGGGGADGQGGGTCAIGAGGGGGGWAYSKILAAALGATETVTIGAGGAGGAGASSATGATGGTTQFGTLVTATGGTGGTGKDGSAAVRVAQPGGAGTGGTGDIQAKGSPGTMGVSEAGSARFCAGNGGGSLLGGGPRGRQASAVGTDAAVAGAGGAGGASYDAAANYGGGDGADGIVIVKEYF